MNKPRFIAAVLGARMNYAVPRTLHQAGMLSRLYTDYTLPSSAGKLLSMIPPALLPATAKRAIARKPKNIPSDLITSFNSFGKQYRKRLASAHCEHDKISVYIWAGKQFAELVNTATWQANAVYVYNTAGLEILTKADSLGITKVLEQTSAPREVEEKILEEEYAGFPDWEDISVTKEPEYAMRQHEEWKLADTILCGSKFVMDNIVRCGAEHAKCKVVPYGIELPAEPSERISIKGTPLKVLFAGRVCLQKGAQYVFGAAKKLGKAVTIRCVGNISLKQEVIARQPLNIEFTGPVPSQSMDMHYRWADVMLFPSLCEGSAAVTYEALSYGLPVICTPNSGSVVRDGYNGMIIPPRSTEASADNLTRLIDDRDLISVMSANAIISSKDFSIEQYGVRLLKELRQK